MNKQHFNRWAFALVAGILLLTGLGAQKAKAESYNGYIGVSFQVFYDELMPYGDWVRDARYGYIWLPAVGPDFHPYGSNGHWAMTEYGNTWVSYYDWGWAPFHYGRWYFDDYYQSWAWIPGYDWGPAWVSWRSGGGYYGWAPLGPTVSVNVRIGIPSFHWVFLPQVRIYDRYAYRHYAPYRNRVKIINRTTIINNTVVYNNNTYISGPNRREIERVTRRAVPVYQLRASNRPGRAAMSRNAVDMYRPEINASRGRTADARPSRVVEPNQARSNRSTYATPSSRNANQGSRTQTRSATPSSRGNQGGSRVNSAPSRSSNSGVRSANPSSGRGSEFQTKPYQDNRSRTSAPSQSRQRSVGTQSSPSRQNNVRTAPSQQRQSNVRTAPSQQRQSNVRTAPSQQRQSNVRTAPSRSNSQVRSSSRTQTSRPAVKQSAPSRQSGARVSSQSSRSSAPKVSRTSPSRSSSSTGSRSSRGNNRGN
ncbi:DUF6600 domain-containing protein [Algoriphagus sp. CAU 1675]|uniref:DUF6600 domain-containing protein n=1 Tax=Algoriphagus sp. CAU 1675 TaxID=3032597 RepID=UPI0023DAF134|nr:DUF6600 domain-containing protein [Algoriphagus sp. CAU 1675]MDF2157287.1 hypothetical protein [Algoriphagus sp. CAU 1675]